MMYKKLVMTLFCLFLVPLVAKNKWHATCVHTSVFNQLEHEDIVRVYSTAAVCQCLEKRQKNQKAMKIITCSGRHGYGKANRPTGDTINIPLHRIPKGRPYFCVFHGSAVRRRYFYGFGFLDKDLVKRLDTDNKKKAACFPAIVKLKPTDPRNKNVNGYNCVPLRQYIGEIPITKKQREKAQKYDKNLSIWEHAKFWMPHYADSLFDFPTEEELKEIVKKTTVKISPPDKNSSDDLLTEQLVQTVDPNQKISEKDAKELEKDDKQTALIQLRDKSYIDTTYLIAFKMTNPERRVNTSLKKLIEDTINKKLEDQREKIVAVEYHTGYMKMTLKVLPTDALEEFINEVKKTIDIEIVKRHPNLPEIRQGKDFWADGFYMQTLGSENPEALAQYLKADR